MKLAAKRQPVLDAQRASIDEARARLDVVERERWPKVTVGVQYALENGATSGLPGEHIVLGQLRFPLPLWQTNQGAVGEAAANVRVAEAELDQKQRALLAALLTSSGAVDAAARRIDAYGSEVLPRLQRNLELVRKAFSLGEIDVLQVSVARERFLATERDVLNAYSAYFTAAADLEASIGSEVWPDEHAGGDT